MFRLNFEIMLYNYLESFDKTISLQDFTEKTPERFVICKSIVFKNVNVPFIQIFLEWECIISILYRTLKRTYETESYDWLLWLPC